MSEPTKKSWYETGFDGVNKEEQRLATMGGPGRLWIPPGERREIVFVDDEPACIYEHNPKMNGSYRNWMTCLKGVYDECPACKILGENTRYYVGYFTVIDCTKWRDKRGNEHQYEVSLLAAKLKTLKKFRRKKDDNGSLVGKLYRATREDDKSPTCGDEFEMVREVDMDKLFQHALYRGKKLTELWQKARENDENTERLAKTFKLAYDEDGKVLDKIVPFNYYEILHPKTPKELRELLGNAEADSEDSGGRADEEVPF